MLHGSAHVCLDILNSAQLIGQHHPIGNELRGRFARGGLAAVRLLARGIRCLHRALEPLLLLDGFFQLRACGGHQPV